ncbi:MAG: Nif3-like dinuclear metal center hexameric protein [Armatimonadota bacterium]
MNRDELVNWLNDYLVIDSVCDYPNAFNGLQIEGKHDIHRVAMAVDFCEATVQQAISAQVDMLLVHHGAFWTNAAPITNRTARRLIPVIKNDLNIYAVHLPLDRHPEVGNNVQIGRALGGQMVDEFYEYSGVKLGVIVEIPEVTISELAGRLSAMRLPVTVHGNIGLRISRLAICSGGGGDALYAASQKGCQAFLTGEAVHHQALDAEELGVSLLLGGHYQTETYGVRALGNLLAQIMHLEVVFLDHPTGL